MEKRKIFGSSVIAIVLIALLSGMVYGNKISRMPEQGENRVNHLADHQIDSESGIVTEDLSSGLTPEDLANGLIGKGITATNVTLKGANSSAGIFTGGEGILGFEKGIILSTGDIAFVKGPNEFDDVTAVNDLPGNPELETLIPGTSTYDATVLEFDFVPESGVIQFEYIFASDEYNEFVNSEFNDVFGFFVNGENIALIPGTSTPVSINSVNKGNPLGMNASNPEYYINNDPGDGGGEINTQMDGLTVVLTATSKVSPGERNHIKIAIADADDVFLDSNVILKAESFFSPTLMLEPLSAASNVNKTQILNATLVNGKETPIAGEEITFTVTEGPNAGTKGTGITDENGTATWDYTGTKVGLDTITALESEEKSNKVTIVWKEEKEKEKGQEKEKEKGQEQGKKVEEKEGEDASELRLVLEPENSTNIFGTTHVVRAVLTRNNGTPIVNEPVTFNITEGPFAGLSTTKATDAHGTVIWSYGITPGTDTIIATAGGETSSEASKTWKAAEAAEAAEAAPTLLTLEPVTSTSTIGSLHTIRAKLVDEGGTPRSGVMISFIVREGPHLGTSGASLTDENGTATWCYYGLFSGNDTITAAGNGQISKEIFKNWEAEGTNASQSKS